MALPVQEWDETLLAIFAVEARAHLARIEAGAAALGQNGGRAALAATLVSLHTLAGAARSVGLLDLECLCRALERVFGAVAAADTAHAWGEPVGAALALAPQLIGAPSGRIRNQALALCSRLDAIASQLAHAAPTP